MRLILTLIALMIGGAGYAPKASSAITAFGIGATPSDGGDNAGDHSLTPPGSMAENDLVIISTHCKSGSPNDFDFTDAAGQTWNDLGLQTYGSTTHQVWWAEFDGTWDNPTVDINTDTGSPCSSYMLVFRPNDSNSSWSVDASADFEQISAPSDPFDITKTGITTMNDGALVVVGYHSSDNNTFSFQTGGVTVFGDSDGYTNINGTDIGAFFGWFIDASAGATGNITAREETLGGDSADAFIVSFLETPPSAPTFDTGVAYVSATDAAMTISFDASADADTYYAALYGPGDSQPTAAAVKAGTGAHGTATDTPTGASQNVAITSDDSPEFPYYSVAVVLESAAGLSSVEWIAGTFATTPMDDPYDFMGTNDAQWVAYSGSAESGGIADGASPALVQDDDVIECGPTTPGGYAIEPEADGGFVIYDGGDPDFQSFTCGAWRKSDETWDTASWSANNNDPAPCSASPLLDGLVPVVGQPVSIDIEGQMCDDDGHTVECQSTGDLPAGLSYSEASGVLDGTLTTPQAAIDIELTCDDGWGGQYVESAQTDISSVPINRLRREQL